MKKTYHIQNILKSDLKQETYIQKLKNDLKQGIYIQNQKNH